MEDVRRRIKAGESKVSTAEDLGVGEAALYRALAEYGLLAPRGERNLHTWASQAVPRGPDR